MHLLIYFHLNDLEIGKHYNLDSEKVNLAWYHHLTHITCAQKLRGLRQKLDALRVQTGPSLSKYKGFRRKLTCYKDISFFLSLFQLKTFFASKTCNIQSHILKFQPFLTSFDIFMHFMIYFQLNHLEIGKGYNMNSEKVETWHGVII